MKKEENTNEKRKMKNEESKTRKMRAVGKQRAVFLPFFSFLFSFFTFTFTFSFLFYCCSAPIETADTAMFTSLHDIPGITQEEKAGIDALREIVAARGYPLTVGNTHNTEAFIAVDGTIGGFTLLFCEWLSGLFDIPFEPVLYSLNEALTGLLTGKFDLGFLTMTEERREIYHITDPIIHRNLKIMRIYGSLSPHVIASMRTVRYVFLRNATQFDVVSALLPPGSFEPLFADTYDEMYHVLARGEADAMIVFNTTEASFDVYGDIVIEDFLPLSVSPLSLFAGNSEFEPIISIVTKALNNGAYAQLTEMYRKGQQEYLKNKFLIRLTDEEKAYISENPVIPYAALYLSYPDSFYDDNDGKWKGIVFDMMDELEQLTGFTFEMINENRTELPDLLRMLEGGSAYFIPYLTQSDERRERFLLSEVMLMRDNFALLSKNSYPNVELNDIPFERVGFARGSVFAEVFRLWFPNAIYAVEYPSIAEAFNAAERGEIDLVLTNRSRLLALTNYYEFSNYKTNYTFNAALEYSVIYNKDQPVFASIIDKALTLINTDRIVDYWQSTTYNFEAMRLRQQRPLIIGIAIILALALAVLTFLYTVNWKKNKTITESSAKLLKAQETLAEREKLMEALSRSAIQFLAYSSKSFLEIMEEGVKPIADAAEIHRLSLWRNIEKPDGLSYARQLYIWDSKTGVTNEPLEQLKGDLSITDFAPRWVEILQKGESVNGPADIYPEVILLRAMGVASIYINPIFINGSIWGYGFFEDRENKRYFNENISELFRSASYIFANAVIRDELITQLKEATEKAQEDEERMRLIIDALPIACLLINRSHNIIDTNQAANDLYKFDGKNDKDLQINRFMPLYQSNGKDSIEFRREVLEKAFSEGYIRFQFMHQNLDGEALPCDITLIRLKYKGEDIVAAYVRDLREQMALIEEIRKAEIAQESSKAKSLFLANMSHEIRTPMNSIIGFAELAHNSANPPKTNEYLDKINESADLLLTIINDILDISKIEAGKMELEKIPFDLHGIFSYCRTSILPKAEEKGLVLYCYAEPSVGKKLLGDPVRLRQVLLNLLSNAVKFTNVGTIKLLASIIETGDKHVTVNFEVKDSGIGMSEEQLKKVFEPFMQADNSIARKYGGTGLGLTITKSILETMGGKLEVESVPGVGSKFNFELTFDTIDDLGEAAEKIVLNNFEKPNFEGEILVFEDNSMNQQVIGEHLERVGVKTVIANNGKEGIDIIQKRLDSAQKMFDLIFMDIHMPVMDGLEAAAKIIEMGVKTPILAMTANIMTSDIEMYKKCGMSDSLGKPFTSVDLWKCLLKYLPLKKHSAPANNDEDEELQRKLILIFAKNSKNTFKEFKNALDERDIELAHRIVHSLKGNAAQVGEMVLSNAARDAEAALKNGENNLTEEQTNTLERELKKSLDKFSPLLESELEKEDKNRESIALNSVYTEGLFDQLEKMLQNNNPLAMNMLGDIRMITGTEKLINCIENLDFKQALDELLKIRQEAETK